MAEHDLDTRGSFCPIPIIEAAKAMRGLAPGDVLRLRASDPGILSDLPAWCSACGHALLSLDRTGVELVGRVQKRETTV